MAAKLYFRQYVMTLVLLLGTTSAFAADELRETFFKDADAAKAAAEAVDAKLLSPNNWERGMAEYVSAETALERGRNIETVRSEAANATRFFRDAKTSADLAKVKLAQVMKSRQDAANAHAPAMSPEIWLEAQRKFADAIRYLERGDLKTTSRREVEATSLYREAELVAIKAEYLTETRQLLADADRARVGRYAPITLGRAKQLLANAERELNENRYDTDLPRSLARQANYEAKHAIYLSEVVRRVRDKELTAEQLVLQWEASLREVAGSADVQPDMEDGPDKLAGTLVAYIDSARVQLQALSQDRVENEARLAEMEEELASLDERLGGATAERAALVQRLEAQARVKEQFEKVDKMFSANEARVFREGNNIILRLVGLTFDSGSAQLRSETFDLLAKVEMAIDVFPRSELIIEGHTDSFGGDESNQKLSQLRAEAVQQYMINAMRIPTYRLIATGYGETRPIASNETDSGRERNRRIDIVIRPNLETN